MDTQRYFEDAMVTAALEEALVETVERQDAVAPKYRLCHVPATESTSSWTGVARR